MSGSNQLYNKNFSNQSGVAVDNITANGLNVSQGVLLANTPSVSSNSNEIATTAFVKTALTNATTFNSLGGNIYYNGNVAINKSSPVYPLDVSGTINTSSNILCNGSIGIGTTSPAYQLDVSGIIRSSGDMLIRNTGWLRFENTGGMYWTTFGGGLTMTDTSFVRVHNGKSFYCAGNINSGGNVGIGIGATNPSYALDVSGAIRATNNVLCSGSIGVATTSPSYALDVSGAIRATNNMYCASKLGIGTTTPAYTLDVSGTANFTGVVSTITPATATNTTQVATTAFVKNCIASSSTTFSLNGSNAYYTAGSVGIGTTTPAYTLDVSGSLRTSSLILNNAPIFSAYGSTTETLSAGVSIVIVCDSQDYVVGNCYDDTTGIFQPKLPGYYEIKGTAGLTCSGQIALYAYRNGSYHANLGQNTASTSGFNLLQGSCIMPMNGTTDYCTLVFWSSAGGSMNHYNSRMQGYYLRAFF